MSDKNIHKKRERKSESRRSSILKRQDTYVLSEGTDGSSDGPRTPRRVSFATTAMIREFQPAPWHMNASSESSGCQTDTSSSTPSPGVDQDHDDVFLPNSVPAPQIKDKSDSPSPNTSLTEEFLAASPDDQPRVLVEAINTFIQDVEREQGKTLLKEYEVSVSRKNQTILFTNADASECGMEMTSNISHYAQTFLKQDDADYMVGASKSCPPLKCPQGSSEPNKTILFTDMDESVCGMDLTSNISQLSQSWFQQQEEENENLDTTDRHMESGKKPGLNRQRSFSDPLMNEVGDEQAFHEIDAAMKLTKAPEPTIVFGANSGRGGMDLTENLTTYSSAIDEPRMTECVESLLPKPKPKHLDDLFKLVRKPAQTFVPDPMQTFVPGLAKTCVPEPAQASVPDLQSNEELTNVELDDMNLTGDQSQAVSRSALQDIIVNKALTPIEEMSVISTNISLVDQASHLISKSSFAQQSQKIIPQVCSRLEQFAALPVSAKTAFVMEKENFPLISIGHKLHREGQAVVNILDKENKTLHFGNWKADGNDSLGDMEMTECQTKTIHVAQDGVDDDNDPEIQLRIPSKEVFSMNTTEDEYEPHRTSEYSQGKQQNRLNQSGSYVRYEDDHDKAANNIIDASIKKTLERDVQGKEDTIYFRNNEDMEFTTANTKTIHIGPTSPQRQRILTADTIRSLEDNMEMTTCKTKPILPSQSLQSEYPVLESSSESCRNGRSSGDKRICVENSGPVEKTKVFDNCNMEMTQSMATDKDGVDTITEKSQLCRYQQDRTQCFDNCNMELTECSTKTSVKHEGNQDNTEKLSNENYAMGTAKLKNSSWMEMTEYVTHTIHVARGVMGEGNLKPVDDRKEIVVDNSSTSEEKSSSLTSQSCRKAVSNEIINLPQASNEVTDGSASGKVFPTCSPASSDPNESNHVVKRQPVYDLDDSKVSFKKGSVKGHDAFEFLSDHETEKLDTCERSKFRGGHSESLGASGSGKGKEISPAKYGNNHEIKEKKSSADKEDHISERASEDLPDLDMHKKREALRAALSKEIGLPLSFSKRSSAIDPFQKRKSCNFDLLLGKKQRDQEPTNRDQPPFSSQNSHNKTVALMNTTGHDVNKTHKALDHKTEETEIMEMLGNTNGIPTFIVEHSGSSTSSQSSDLSSKSGSWHKGESTSHSSFRYSGRNQSSFHGLNSSHSAVPPSPAVEDAEDSLASEVFDSTETLNNQEMPDLADDGLLCSTSIKESLAFEDEALVLSDLDFLMSLEQPVALPSQPKMPSNLRSLYEMLGISKVQEVPSQRNVSVQRLPTSTVREKIYAKVTGVPRVECLEQHLKELESSISRTKQECKDRMQQLSIKPPEAFHTALQDHERGRDLRRKAQDMMNACRTSARAKWKKRSADYLMKYSTAREAACSALDSEVEHLISETERVLERTTSVDKCLLEIDQLLSEKEDVTKVQKELEETESENQQLRLQCKEMDEKVVALTQSNKDVLHRLELTEAAQDNMEERLSWMGSLTEWNLLKNTGKEMHFSFLFGTIIMKICLMDSHGSDKKISKISLHSRLGAKSKSWAKLAHATALASIDCCRLQETYEDYTRISQLLEEVSSVMCASRLLNTELRYVHLKHHLNIEENRLTVYVSNGKTRQKIQMSTTLLPNTYPLVPLVWDIKTILGNILSQDLQQAVTQVPVGHKYITRTLQQVENLLANCKR